MSPEPRSIAPDLIGLSLREAGAAAAWAGTRISATDVARHRGPWGVVFAQSPSPGTRMEARWRITVLISAPHPPDGAADA